MELKIYNQRELSQIKFSDYNYFRTICDYYKDKDPKYYEENIVPVLNNQKLSFVVGNKTSYSHPCPYCHQEMFPIFSSKISVGGWIIFALLLVVFFPLCWIGLLIQEKIKYCPNCKGVVN